MWQVVQVFSVSIQGIEVEDCYQFEVNVSYIVGFKIVWDIDEDNGLENNKKRIYVIR